MFDMRVHSSKHDRKCLMLFQKGILLTNKSLRNLFSDVNDMYNMKYITTRVLNQDVLENCFSYLQGMRAANIHPTPLEFQMCSDQDILATNNEMKLLNEFECEVKKKNNKTDYHLHIFR